MRFLFLAERIFQWSSLFIVYFCYLWLASTMGGCSSGPQLPITTPVLNISCTWNNMDGGASEDCDCLIDRSSTEAEAQTTGNDNRGLRVDPSTQISVPVGTGSTSAAP